MADVSSPNAWRQADETQLYHLIELIREGDEIKVNQRKRPLTVTEVYDSEHNRVLACEGNGTRYSLIMDRFEGEPTDARIQFPSGFEKVGHLKVANRNAINPRVHDHLSMEEIPSKAPREYREGINGYVERTERTFGEDGMEAVKWAVKAFVDYYREGGRMGGGPTARGYYQDALAMWERIRGWEGEWTFYGAEMGLIGAYLDYAVEDLSIRDRIPERVVGVIESIRKGEDPDGFDLPSVEDSDNPELVTDGGPVTAKELMRVFDYIPGEPPNPIHGEVTGEIEKYGHPWVYIGSSYESRKRWKQRLDDEGYEYHHPEDGRYHNNVKRDTVVITGRVEDE